MPVPPLGRRPKRSHGRTAKPKKPACPWRGKDVSRMPYKDAEVQRAYLQQWRRRRRMEARSPAERALMEEAERLLEASLRVNDFVALRKTVQQTIALVKKLLEAG